MLLSFLFFFLFLECNRQCYLLMEMPINVVVVVVVVVVQGSVQGRSSNGTFWRETCRFASWDGAFDKTGEEWVQKENVFIR